MSKEFHNLFFIKDEQNQGSKLILTGPEYHHIKNVLRKKLGERIYFTDGKGHEYETEIEQILPNALVLRLLNKNQILSQRTIKIDLGVVPLKSARTDFIIEKGTELGVCKFIFFISKYGVVKNLGQPRIEHFKKVALSAMLQSQQYYLPDIEYTDNITSKFSEYDMTIVGDRQGVDRLILGVKKILLLIGPEGGFAPEEIEIFQKNGIKFLSFSKNRLRSETAAIAGIVSIIAYYTQ